jgi:hypothetical protein
VIFLFLFLDSISVEQAANAVRASHNNPSFKAEDLCLQRPKSWPQLILVGQRYASGDECRGLIDILELRDGKLVSVQTGGFSWPEKTIEKEWNAGEREERAKAPRFTPPAARTVGKKLYVEAWHEEEALSAIEVCYAKHRRILDGKFWSERMQTEVFCTAK